jgi:hypothetical protein
MGFTRQAFSDYQNNKFYSFDISKFLLVFILLLPLLFINIRNDIDWGDDNAHYLLQARYISDGTPQANTQYVFNPDCSVLGPPAYPIGFPLLLSGVYHFKGLNLHAFSLILTLSLIALGILMLFYYRRMHHFLTTVFLILIVSYNPWTLAFKSEIMSEIPFTFILLAITIIYNRYKNPAGYLLTGLLCGCLMSVRTIGVVVPLAFIAESVRNLFVYFFIEKQKGLKIIKHELFKTTGIAALSFGLYALLNFVIFRIPSDPTTGYLSIFRFHGLGTIILQNLAYYTDTLQSFFNPKNDAWIFLPLITKSFVFTMVLIGFFKKLLRGFGFVDLLVILYLVVLIMYPYRQSGFRFLFPLIPFLLSYAVAGLKSINTGLKMKKPLKILIFGALILVQYIYGFNDLRKIQHQKQEGPCTDEAWVAFDYIRKNTPPDAVVAFTKPRALALFADRRSMTNNTADNEFRKASEKFSLNHVTYYLLYCKKNDEPAGGLLDEMTNPSLEKYIAENPAEATLLWSNERFKLYKKGESE